MKRYLLIFVLFGVYVGSHAQQNDWKIVEGKILTEWGAQMDIENPLPEYPRPQMERKNNWKNLNGLWEYAIRNVNESVPTGFDGKILVPFPCESALSGVGKMVGKDNNLWYKCNFMLPRNLKGKRIILHFGGVDWQTEVFVNGIRAGMHEGAFDPFSFDITSLVKGKEQELLVKVWDPTNDGPQPRGKQVKDPQGIWYVPVTGIWQTVWLEFVPETHIVSFKQTPDIDMQQLDIEVNVANPEDGDVIKIAAYDAGNKIEEQRLKLSGTTQLKIPDPKLWSPSNPYLYDLKISIERRGKVIDEVKSYFAMRKISMKPDKNGIQRMMLNNEFVFQYGPLDQGWWPDGLFTAPTDEALKFDIIKAKEMGFNMIRKHVKVEPARWYYYCDLTGMLVWQDMPSGDNGGNKWMPWPGVISVEKGKDKVRTEKSETIYRKEWNAIMDSFHNFPSIIVWVPFNEAWGQFKTVEITELTMQKDPSRLVNSASGGSYFHAGHMVDLHHYPQPAMPRPELFGAEQALVLGEFGGLGLPVEGHTWQDKDNWGYQNLKNEEELLARYTSFVSDLDQLIDEGLSAAVYTQITDVEVETNGLITYDRKVVKVPEAKLKAMHQKLYDK